MKYNLYQKLENGEQALISYVDNKPVGMVRFRLNENGLCCKPIKRTLINLLLLH